ncbi:MAG TPA: hypothetical protein VEQ63_04655 [Bryobacteraceae bacterium]|nr:hypothetical protein [Bryobacteraceae bacterium]
MTAGTKNSLTLAIRLPIVHAGGCGHPQICYIDVGQTITTRADGGVPKQALGPIAGKLPLAPAVPTAMFVRAVGQRTARSYPVAETYAKFPFEYSDAPIRLFSLPSLGAEDFGFAPAALQPEPTPLLPPESEPLQSHDFYSLDEDIEDGVSEPSRPEPPPAHTRSLESKIRSVRPAPGELRPGFPPIDLPALEPKIRTFAFTTLRPKMKLKPKSAPAPAEAAPALDASAATQSLPTQQVARTFEASGMPAMAKAAMAAILAIFIAAASFVAASGRKFGGTVQRANEAAITDATVPNVVLGGGGWSSSWGSSEPSNRNKQISIYRPSAMLKDYRFEFKGQIARKAMGWVFRADDPKIYYVMKLETIKPGANPIVALVKYAVIRGKETTHTQVLLPLQPKIDTLYDVRVDVKGDRFSTYIQGKLVDYWTDDRIKRGGAGFYNEAGEQAVIKSSQVAYLVAGGA